jgi:hypothetical protein
VHPGDALDGGATRPGLALVAGAYLGIAEVAASGALQQVAADGGHVAQLGGGAEQQRLADERQPVPHCGVGGQLLHRGQRGDPQPVAVTADSPQRQPSDVDEPAGVHDPVLERQVQLRRAAGEERGVGVLGHQCHGGIRVRGADVLDPGRCHESATSRIAATMFG